MSSALLWKVPSASICRFMTLVRFDLAYFHVFQINKRKLTSYPRLHAYVRDLCHRLPLEKIVDWDSILHYFRSFGRCA